MEPVSLNKSDLLSQSIVNFVARSRTDVLLNDAVNEGMFVHDPFILKNRPKSVLRTPILKQSQLIGILYLENNLSTGVFTSGSLKMLKLLSSQVAISLENARLYDQMLELNISLEEHKNNLETLVDKRTKQLKETQQKLLEAAHKAGMAEIATGVLHNIGNILNSLSLSSQVISNTLKKSALSGLLQDNDLLNKNINDVGGFITNSPKGQKIPRFYISVGEMIKNEHFQLSSETDSILDKISLTKKIVSE